MPEFIYRIQPTRADMLATGPTPEESRIVGEHFRHLQSLAQSGVVLLAGRTQTSDEQSFGIVILEAADEAHARQLMESDPAVAQGVMRASLWPFRVAVASRSATSP